MKRRDLLGRMVGGAAAAAAAIASAPGESRAERAKGGGVPTPAEYAVRAALLLDETRRAQDFVGGHPEDVGLAALAFTLAEARSSAASQIAAPPALKQAHMHLLLVLESTAASFDATSRGEAKKAAQRMSAARLEERTFFLALEASKVRLPSLK